MKYRMKMFEVDAVQWTGTNKDELGRFGGIIWNDFGDPCVNEDGSGHLTVVSKGSWILRDGSDFRVLGNDNFVTLYRQMVYEPWPIASSKGSREGI